ncbi:MAG: hypothetical protein QXX68_01970 [Candidatus Pacearchaeota archaeon]
MKNKRADMIYPIVIFIVLNIIFMSLMLIFVNRVSSEALRYEEIYAKKIGLMLNRAERGDFFEINITDLIKNAQKNRMDSKFMQEEMIIINTTESFVQIKTKKEGGFVYHFFSKIEIDESLTKIHLDVDNQNRTIGGKLLIGIK